MNNTLWMHQPCSKACSLFHLCFKKETNKVGYHQPSSFCKVITNIHKSAAEQSTIPSLLISCVPSVSHTYTESPDICKVNWRDDTETGFNALFKHEVPHRQHLFAAPLGLHVPYSVMIQLAAIC